MNKERLMRLSLVLEQLPPQEFDLGSPTRCILAWAVKVFGGRIRSSDQRTAKQLVAQAAAFIGITIDEAEELGFPDYGPDGVWPYDVSGKQAAQAVRRLANTGVVAFGP